MVSSIVSTVVAQCPTNRANPGRATHGGGNTSTDRFAGQVPLALQLMLLSYERREVTDRTNPGLTAPGAFL